MKNQRIPASRDLPGKLDAARKQFEQWRSQHPPRTHLPQPLWAQAAKLAREFGLNQTARALRLNYYGLKKRLDPAVGVKPAQVSPNQAFLELRPVPVTPDSFASECTIECQDATGAQIRIQLKGIPGPDLSTLCGELWRPAR